LGSGGRYARIPPEVSVIELSAHRILESAAEATQEKDQDCLRESLVRTITECLPVRRAQVIRIGDEEADEAPDAPADLLEDLRGWFGGAGADVAAPFSRSLDAATRLEVLPLNRGRPVTELLMVELASQRPEDLRVLHAFARLYANFLDLIRDAGQDRLTGLYNRRSFDVRLSLLVNQAHSLMQITPPRDPARQRSGPMRWWLALLDVDHFKKVNDTFGHLYGDEVLLLLSRILTRSFRGDDRCFRYGGEEFAVVLGASDLDGAQGALERMRQRVEQHSFPQVGRVTISIGCAALEPGSGPSDIIGRADRALYHAKGHGRNQVACFDALCAANEMEDRQRVGDVVLF
jgi:diguanylate cyclase (GGDEF)-like protein